MFAFEQHPQSFHQQQYFDTEIKQETYMPSMLDYPYESINYNPELFGEVHHDNKYNMMRSLSQGSYHQIHSETAPSLLSSVSAPSVPSAPSSTVGSPYSSHALPVTTTGMYGNYVGGPAIVCDDGLFAYEPTHFEHDAFIDHDVKSTQSFVGKSADLSSFVTRSTRRGIQECSPMMPPVSSSKSYKSARPTILNKVARQPQRLDSRSSSTTTRKPRLNTSSPKRHSEFKSPTTPASAYRQNFSPILTRTTFPPLKLPASIPKTPGSQASGFSHFFSRAEGHYDPFSQSFCLSPILPITSLCLQILNAFQVQARSAC